jgi:hypothetical protein
MVLRNGERQPDRTGNTGEQRQNVRAYDPENPPQAGEWVMLPDLASVRPAVPPLVNTEPSHADHGVHGFKVAVGVVALLLVAAGALYMRLPKPSPVKPGSAVDLNPKPVNNQGIENIFNLEKSEGGHRRHSTGKHGTRGAVAAPGSPDTSQTTEGVSPAPIHHQKQTHSADGRPNGKSVGQPEKPGVSITKKEWPKPADTGAHTTHSPEGTGSKPAAGPTPNAKPDSLHPDQSGQPTDSNNGTPKDQSDPGTP